MKISFTFAFGHIKEIALTCGLSAWSHQELLASQLARLSLVMVGFGQPASSYYCQSSSTSSPASSWPYYAEVSPPATTLSYFAFPEASAYLQKFNDHLLNQGLEHLYEPVHLLPAHKYVIMTIIM